MIRFFTILATLCTLSSIAMAQDISVNVDGKIYYCTDNGTPGLADCSAQLDGLDILVSSCMETYGSHYCMDKYWPSFVSDFPECKAEGLPACIEACKGTYGGAYCAEECNNV